MCLTPAVPYLPTLVYFPEAAFALPAAAESGLPTYLYDNIFKMCAICRDNDNQELSLPLVARGSELLEFEIQPGQWWKSGVPATMADPVLKKRPAAAAAAATPSASKKQKVAEPAQQPSEQPAQQSSEQPADQPSEQPADQPEKPAEESSEQPTDQPRLKISGKQTLVEGIIMVHAKTGKERAYCLAKIGKSKPFLVEISKHASPKYLELVKGLCVEMSSWVSKGVDFNTLKAWAKAKKTSLLTM